MAKVWSVWAQPDIMLNQMLEELQAPIKGACEVLLQKLHLKTREFPFLA